MGLSLTTWPGCFATVRSTSACVVIPDWELASKRLEKIEMHGSERCPARLDRLEQTRLIAASGVLDGYFCRQTHPRHLFDQIGQDKTFTGAQFPSPTETPCHSLAALSSDDTDRQWGQLFSTRDDPSEWDLANRNGPVCTT